MVMRSNVHATSPVAPSGGVAGRATIVIVAYNGAAYIVPCLRSLMATGARPDDVLVVDNASTDDTVAVVRREFPMVRVLPGRSNLGYGAASNLGASLSRAEYLLVMNQDVVSASDWTTALVRALEADPSIALATPQILVQSDPRRVNARGNTPHYTGITSCRGYNQPAGGGDADEEVPAVSGAAFAVRSTVFAALGGFDPSFFLYLEDTDLSLRAVLAGYRCVCVPEAVVLHDFEPRFSTDKLFFLERNRYAMLLKLYRWRTLLVLTPALLLTELAVWGYSVLGGPRRFWAKCRAHAWLLRHLPAVLRARRRVQARRRIDDRALLARCAAELELEELGGTLGRLTMRVTNPLFRSWYRVAGAVVRW